MFTFCVNVFCKAYALKHLTLLKLIIFEAVFIYIMNYAKEGGRTPALFVIFLFLKEILVTLSQNRKQNLETLYKCQIRRFLSDLPLDSSRVSIGGDVSALAEFAEKLSLCLPLHPFYPSLSPDSSACYLTLGFPRVQISKQISPNQCWFSTQF